MTLKFDLVLQHISQLFDLISSTGLCLCVLLPAHQHKNCFASTFHQLISNLFENSVPPDLNHLQDFH